jgi:tetratricopeptide (TPR) repeat protein
LDLYYANLATAVSGQGRFSEAKGLLERALAIQGGRAGATTLMILGSMATLDNRMERPDAAMDAVERGMALAGTIGEAKWVPFLLVARARARLNKADAAGAAGDCARVLEMQESRGALAPDALYAPDALTCLGEAELALRNVETAVEHLERSVMLERRPGIADLAAARFALARALVLRNADGDHDGERVRQQLRLRDNGRGETQMGIGAASRISHDVERATDLARRALDDFRQAPGRENEAADVEKWLEGI